jgi:hypothetical protein
MAGAQMRRSSTFVTLVLTLALFAVGAVSSGTAEARPRGTHAAQGRAKKKHHRPKSARPAHPKPAKSASATKKNDRGFEL